MKKEELAVDNFVIGGINTYLSRENVGRDKYDYFFLSVYQLDERLTPEMCGSRVLPRGASW